MPKVRGSNAPLPRARAEDVPAADETKENRAQDAPGTAAAAREYWDDAVTGVPDYAALVRDNEHADRLPEGMAVEVPVVPREGASLLYFDPELLKELGLPAGKYGRMTPEQEAALTHTFALRPAQDGEEATQTVVATRYHDLSRGEGYGAPLGDGRAGIIGKPLAIRMANHDSRTRERLANLRVKGVPTGLKPRDVAKGDGHSTGAMSEMNAIADTILASYCDDNGIVGNRAPAVASTQDEYSYHYVLNNKKVPFTSRVGFQLQAGSFDRLAHLTFLEDKPAEMRALIDDVGHQVARELGRETPLSHAGLYTLLVGKRARQLADRYWSRMVHGSTTFDNVGLRETIDIATAATVDRAHPTYRPIEHISDGFGREAEHVLRNAVAGELTGYFHRTATADEKVHLDVVDPGRLAYSTWSRRMAANTLEHTGLDPDAIKTLLKHESYAVYDLFDAVLGVGETQAVGARHAMGPEGKDEVKDPANYDIFAALSQLAGIWGSDADDDEKVQRLVTALAPLVPDAATDQAAAQLLLHKAGPVLERALAGTTGDVRAARLALIADQAGAINAPVTDLTSTNLREIVKDKLDAMHDGELSVTRLRADMRALLRKNKRRGPEAPHSVAQAIRHDTVTRDEDGRLELARVEENGVLLQELSDGARDLVRVAIATNPMALDDVADTRLRYTLDGETFHEATPVRTNGDEAVFEVPLDARPDVIEASFFSASDPAIVFDQDGAGFGGGHRPVLGSARVDAELAAFARRHALRRERTPDAVRKAVSGLAPTAVEQRSVDLTSLADTDATRSIASVLADAERPLTPVGELYRLTNGATALAVHDGKSLAALVASDAAAWRVPAELYDLYEVYARELGLPVGDSEGDGSSLAQQFENGAIRFTAAEGAVVELGR